MPSAVMGGTSSGEGGGITNSAPVNTIPVTLDGDGNLGDSNIEWVGNALTLQVGENGTAQLLAGGVGAQWHIEAADGDEEHVGGEVLITSGSSQGQNGGDVQISSGGDANGGDSGGMTLQTGDTPGASDQGDVGDLIIRGGNSTDGDAGRVLISGGTSDSGDGGTVRLSAGPSTSGTDGSIEMFSADSNQGAQVNNTAFTITDKLSVGGNVGFYGTSPVARPEVPASPSNQDIADALVALGLITQAAP